MRHCTVCSVAADEPLKASLLGETAHPEPIQSSTVPRFRKPSVMKLGLFSYSAGLLVCLSCCLSEARTNNRRIT